MRARNFILMAMLCAAVSLPDAASAQLSPQGVFGTVTRPFRQMFDRLRHPPAPRRHTANVGRSAGAAVPAAAPVVLGLVGPRAWPDAYADVLGYTFWQDDYAQDLHGQGFDVIADTLTKRFEVPRAVARAATTGANVENDASAATPAGPCDDTSRTQDDWPAARIEQTAQLSDDQKKALGKLQAAVIESTKTIKAACRSGPLSAPDRLNGLVQMLWVVRDAGVFVRAPLADFYDSLTDAQKSKFKSEPLQGEPDPDSKNARKSRGGANKQSQACAAQNLASAERLIKTIGQRVKPDKEQAASLENLREVSSDMAKLLMASCMQPVPADPLARLDAAINQLTAMNYATTTMQIAFNDFYTRLDDGQKSRLDGR